MGSLWATLAPFVIAAALMPIELVITLALLGTPGRVRTATAATVGTVAVRLLKGLVFGAILHWGRRDNTAGGHGWLVSAPTRESRNAPTTSSDVPVTASL